MTTTDIRTIFGGSGIPSRYHTNDIDVKVVLMHDTNGPIFMVQGAKESDFADGPFTDWLDKVTTSHPNARVLMFADEVTVGGGE